MTEDGIPLEWKLKFWLYLGIPLSLGWLLLIAIFVRPPTRRGLAWWVLPAVAVLAVAPGLGLVGVWLETAAQPALYRLSRITLAITEYWWVVPCLFAVGALVFVGLWFWRSRRPAPRPWPELQLVPPPPAPAPVVQQVVQPGSEEFWRRGPGLTGPGR